MIKVLTTKERDEIINSIIICQTIVDEHIHDILAFTKITENLANICILVCGTNRLDKVMDELKNTKIDIQDD